MKRALYIGQDSERGRKAIRITVQGSVVNLILVLGKIAAGVLGRSGAMIADGLHSLTDFASDILIFLGFRIVNKPPDKSHHYGHGKFETLLTITVALMIIFAGFLIVASSLHQIYSAVFLKNTISKPGIVALIAALISIVSKEALYRVTRRVGEEINSDAVIANAWHHRSDAFSSVATFFGIGGAILLGEKWAILDPIAAFIVSILILIVGIKMLSKSVMELMETSIGADKEEEIIRVVKSVEGALNPHNLKTRKIGNNFAIDIHIEVERDLKITKAHDIATLVEKEVKTHFGSGTHISVHVEPFDCQE